MYYCAIGVLAILVLLIENYDIVFKRNRDLVKKEWIFYKYFLIAVLCYYLTDVLWGLFDEFKLFYPLYVDTVFYFLAMASGVIFWAKYVVKYLSENNVYGKILTGFSIGFFICVFLLLIVNFFCPILFLIDENSAYQGLVVRYVILLVQIVLLVFVSIYTIISIIKKPNALQKKRYIAICGFGIIMATFLTIQLWFPLLPLYSIAYMLGTCLLHTFVINAEKEEYKLELEEAFVRENKQHEELKTARALAYTDALTGAGSKLAYINLEEKIDSSIQNKAIDKFAIAIFDINDLKIINDKNGHEFGDQYIKNAYSIIKTFFKNEDVYRIGGDEFIAYLDAGSNIDYDKVKEEFISEMLKPKKEFEPVVAIGIARYNNDDTFNDVFRRADKEMYANKNMLKEKK